MEESKCGRDIVSESGEQFTTPRYIQRPPTSRKYYNQFMWNEVFDTYKAYTKEETKRRIAPNTTETQEKFYKELPRENELHKIELKRRYPLYSTGAITFYNPKGDPTVDFKRRRGISGPNMEQFG